MIQWEDWQIAFIRLSYVDFGPIPLSEILNVCSATLIRKAKILGVKCDNRSITPFFEKFGRLKIIKLVSRNKHGAKVYLCQCDCGKTTKVVSKHLFSGDVRSCGCYSREIRSKGVGDISGCFFSRYKQSAKANNRDFNITKEFLSDLLISQEYKCALTKLPIYINKNRNSTGCTASLDRIDSSKGYTKDNVQFLHVDVNRMKLHFPEERFKQVCKLIYKNTLKEYDDKTNDWW